jgi:glycosyltransferase 2 family protein
MKKIKSFVNNLPPWMQSVVRATMTVFILAAIAAAANKLMAKTDISAALCSPWFVLGTLLAIVYRLVNPYGWALVLRGLGFQVSGFAATKTWLHAESRRWLPGGVWGYASRAVQAQKLGVSVGGASASMLVELLITVLAAAIVSAVGVIVYRDKLIETVLTMTSGSTLPWLVAGGAACMVGGWLVRKKLFSKLKRLSEKYESLRGIKIQSSQLFAAIGYMIAMACLNGTVNAVLIRSLTGTEQVPFLVLIAATSTAWVIGLVAFFSPGGILVREAALAALLSPWIPYPVGLALAVMSRLAQLIAEVVGLGCTIRFPALARWFGKETEQVANYSCNR